LRTFGLALPALTLVSALAYLPAQAQTSDEPTGRSGVLGDIRLDEVKDHVTSPSRWERRQWIQFGSVLAGVTLAYQYDYKVRAHFVSDPASNPLKTDYHDVEDALAPALAFGGTWVAAKLAQNEAGRSEAGAMLRAAALSAGTTVVLKLTFARQRPGPGVPRDGWFDGSKSFPSGHTAVAFSVGTVLAESGSDRHRWARRALGYGVIGLGTAYQRLDHDAHWFSDVVAGGALGIATAKLVMKRGDRSQRRGVAAVVPLEGGAMLTYAIPLR
jgi:membrane-associated phospholipid phosphatase